MPLTDTAIRNLKSTGKPTKHSDSGGLHILLSAQGAKLWKMAYRFNGKQKTLSFGIYPAVTLAQARKRRDQAKESVRIQIKWFNFGFELKGILSHLLIDIRRRDCGIASVAV